MQHMGDDGSCEGEHDVGGNSGEQVTSSSRWEAREMFDVRRSGASQTETIDGLESIERLNDAEQAYDYSQADNRRMQPRSHAEPAQSPG